MRALKHLILQRENGRKNVPLRRMFNDVARLAGGAKVWKFRLPEYEITDDETHTTYRYVTGVQERTVENPTVELELVSAAASTSSSSSSAAAFSSARTVYIRMDMFTIPNLTNNKQNCVPVLFVNDEVEINGARYRVTGGTAVVSNDKQRVGDTEAIPLDVQDFNIAFAKSF